jgi:hypothetical protein
MGKARITIRAEWLLCSFSKKKTEGVKQKKTAVAVFFAFEGGQIISDQKTDRTFLRLQAAVKQRFIFSEF